MGNKQSQPKGDRRSASLSGRQHPKKQYQSNANGRAASLQYRGPKLDESNPSVSLFPVSQSCDDVGILRLEGLAIGQENNFGSVKPCLSVARVAPVQPDGDPNLTRDSDNRVTLSPTGQQQDTGVGFKSASQAVGSSSSGPGGLLGGAAFPSIASTNAVTALVASEMGSTQAWRSRWQAHLAMVRDGDRGDAASNGGERRHMVVSREVPLQVELQGSALLAGVDGREGQGQAEDSRSKRHADILKETRKSTSMIMRRNGTLHGTSAGKAGPRPRRGSGFLNGMLISARGSHRSVSCASSRCRCRGDLVNREHMAHMYPKCRLGSMREGRSSGISVWIPFIGDNAGVQHKT